MKCETAIIVDNRMTCVASSLKTDNDDMLLIAMSKIANAVSRDLQKIYD